MIRLSVFGDEIAADVEVQLDAMARHRIQLLDLRAAWGTPVLHLDDAAVDRLQATLEERGIGVSAIATPIGKTPIDAPFETELERFERAAALARRFAAPCIRTFSFYPPRATRGRFDWVDGRAEVLRRLRALTDRARDAGLIVLHENEKDIYGDTAARCVDLLSAIDDPHLRAAFDPANVTQCGETPFPDAYEAVRPWVAYVHVKDALADGTVVVAGEGAARWPDLLARLRADGYDGVFSLEPHLQAAGQFAGFSGPELFHRAAGTFTGLLDTIDWRYR